MRNAKTGRVWIAPSERYKQYETESGWFIKCKNAKIDHPVNVKCLFYMATRRKPDLNNLLEAATDVLVHYKVIADDNANIVAAHDGSRVLYDKDNPRTEIYISDMETGE